MKCKNNVVARKIMHLLMFAFLVGCFHPDGVASFPTNGVNIAKTLSVTPNIPNSQSAMSTSAPAPVLMESSISSGYAVYSVWVSQNPVVSQIFLKNLDTGEITQLTQTGNNDHPIWSPDGSQIMFLSWTKENSYDIYLMDKDGKNQRPIVATSASEMMADWSPDGNKITYVSNIGGGDEIYILNLQTYISIKILIAPPAGSKFPKWSPVLPKWSPDGKRIAFVSGTGFSGTSQIFVMNIDGTGVTQLTDYDLHYDDSPTWCPDASCIIFARVENGPKLMMLDLNNMKESPFLNGIFPSNKNENALTHSQDYVTFYVDRFFYTIDMKSRKIYPLNIEAVNLSLYP